MAEWIPVDDAGGLNDEEHSYGSGHESQTHSSIDTLLDGGHEGSNSSHMGGILYPSTLTDAQEKVLSILFILSAGLSVLGSSTIVIKVLSNRSKASPYDRLMLGLSLSDIIASMTFAMWPFLLPKDTSKRVWAIGNGASCNFLGFLTQLSFAAILYNGVLSYYYLLTVRFGVKRRQMAHCERWMHFIAITFPLATASIGAAFGVFHELEVGFGCWTTNYPENCEEDECTAHIWGYVFGMIPFCFALGSLMVNNIVIYRYVRRIFCQRTTASTSTHGMDGAGGRRISSSASGSEPTTAAAGAAAAAASAEQVVIPKASATNDLRNATQIKEVATQGFLYVGTFFFCYWSALALRLVDHFIPDMNDSKIFPLLLIQSMCLPLQGFFNMLVYNRPNYRRIRNVYPELSELAAIRKACFDKEIPRLTDLTRIGQTVVDDVDLEQEGDSNHMSSLSSLSCSSPSNSNTTTTTTSSCFFQQRSEEYYNACAQNVLAHSARSSGRSIVFSSALNRVVEEEDEDESSGTMAQEGSKSNEMVADKSNKEKNIIRPPLLDDNTQRLPSVGDDTAAAVVIPSCCIEEETKEHYPDDDADSSERLSSSSSLPVGSRSFRIRMDGVVEQEDDKRSSTCSSRNAAEEEKHADHSSSASSSSSSTC